MPGARLLALKAMAEATVNDPGLFRPSGGIEEIVAQLRKIRGVGDWTAHYIRACREPDAFPATDLGVLRGARVIDGTDITPASLLNRAEQWRPERMRPNICGRSQTSAPALAKKLL